MRMVDRYVLNVFHVGGFHTRLANKTRSAKVSGTLKSKPVDQDTYEQQMGTVDLLCSCFGDFWGDDKIPALQSSLGPTSTTP